MTTSNLLEPVSAPVAAATDLYLETAQAIAARLARTAVWDGDRCNWVGTSAEMLDGVFQRVQRAFAADLYSGTAGVALFLALLLEQQPDPVLAETLEGAMAHVLADQTTRNGPGYGYYSGALGVATTLIDLGQRLDRPEWATEGRDRLTQLCTRPPHENEIDVLGGVAGTIPVLLRLAVQNNDPYLTDVAAACGEFLLGRALKQSNAWAWQTMAGQPPLTGYSHGAAGIALALLELYKATNNPAFYTGAMMGFNYERLQFNAQLQNWPDLRNQQMPGTTAAANTPTVYGEAWCHGAPGIALSRLRAWQITQEESFRQEAEMALNTTHRGIYNLVTNPNTPANFSLCHGLAGNGDIMLEGARVLGNELYLQVAQAAGNYGIERYHRNRLHWPSGVGDPSGANAGPSEAPGLMLGLAGTGYFYLRLAFPEKIASLLVL